MLKKTISKIITKKMESWLSTITDPELVKELRRDILVSGGCISSMFLNEPVNDFDVYIKSKATLIKLAKYYTKPHHVDVLDGSERDAIIMKHYVDKYGSEKSAKHHLEDLAFDDSELTVRYKNLKPDQVRLDISSAGVNLNIPKEDLEKELYVPAFFSPNAISLTDNLQIVLRFSGTVEEIHANFDFIHATNYYTMDDGVVTNLAAVESILSKDLKYQGSLYPLTSIIRIKKFVKKGWTINAGEMLKIMFQLSELNLRDINVLEDQLIGIDVAYFSTLLDILRGIEPDKLTGPYLSTIIDKVFNQHEDTE